MKPIDLKALEDLLRPAVDAQGYELVSVAWGREQVGNVFRLIIDRLPGQGYVSHEDCVRVSREVSALLDVNDVLPGEYSLEVSSPGIDRPLKRSADFVRFVGERAKIRLRPSAPQTEKGLPTPKPGVAPQRNFVGKIESVTGSAAGPAANEVIRLIDESSGPVELHLAEIEKANLSPLF